MSKFVPTKRHSREALLFCFHLKKSAAQSQQMLAEAYGDDSPSISTCEYWFRRFKSNDFDTDDKERPGQPKKLDDMELEALIDLDPTATQEELAVIFDVDQSTISRRLKAIGFIQKQGNWLPYELKSRDVERRKLTCELLLQRHKRKSFLHRIITGDEKWIRFDNPKRKKSWCKPGEPSKSISKQNIHGVKLMLCIWWDQIGVVYYELLKSNQTINSELYKNQLTQLSEVLKEKRPYYRERHDKVILQHDNARPHTAKIVQDTLKTLNWEILPHPPYSPDIAPSDFHLFRSMSHGLSNQSFHSYEDTRKWVESWIASKDPSFFRRGIHLLPDKWEKVVYSDGQYFE